ncbi:hypothetical protein N7509_009869 [Penicillium cosmopolitanum]|uniref:Uncharacterized protein n=1 Tax=Penicillium cosmopolitanum TaxID=1131564 RepID=A0A9W9VQA0_9EURO|nr:uncharacterized protein N7509_009869 [Penicillium cosmopolitanum]KAJ5387328.1 hypothetical protein N7509_009869 [Penicillium cosmopolitanum]
MTTTVRPVIRDRATESHFATTGLCNVTSEGVDGARHAASKEYRHVIDTKEAGEPLDKSKSTDTK